MRRALIYLYGQALSLRLLLSRLGIVLLVYTMLRAAFVAYNFRLLGSPYTTQCINIFIGGLRFDISIIAYINIPIVLLHALPFAFRFRSWYQSLLKILFYTLNLPFVLLSLSDTVYFPFTLKRITADVSGMANDFFRQLGSYLHGFWFLLPCLAILIVIMEVLYRQTTDYRERAWNFLAQTAMLLVTVALWVLAARGGFQLKPLSPINAAEYASANATAAVTNTPFSFLYSLTKKKLPEHKYFDNDTAKKYFNIYREPNVNLKPNHMNLVVIVLESFSREYLKRFGNLYNLTPFLDSLYNEGLGCDNAFANAKHSDEGIPAVFASLPTLMDESFIASVYQDDAFMGLGTLLKQANYSTAFFHGAHNGSFNFDRFAARAGFDQYFGMNEYGNAHDYDGQWGIWDEPFLQFAAQQITRMQPPFCAGIFTVSSHYPYSLPEPYKTMYRGLGTHPIHPCVRYADHALMKFFETASHEPWFNNTLFVITADHTSQADKPEYNTPLGTYRIPLLFYAPGIGLKGKVSRAAMQVDILPSVADALRLPFPYVSFGQSVFDSTAAPFAYQYRENVYGACNDSTYLQFNGSNVIGVYNYRRDSLLQHPLPNAAPRDLLNRLEAVIQQYNHAMNADKLFRN